MSKGSFSSNDIFSLRFNQTLSDSNHALDCKGITIKSILNSKKVLGAKNNIFDFYKVKDKLSTLAIEVEKFGVFNVNYNKLDISEDLKVHLTVFINKLALWIQWCDHNDIKPYKNPNWYFIGSITEGFDFGSKLKDIFDYSLRKSVSKYPFSVPDDVKGCEEISDLNAIFPPAHLIPWMSNPDYSDILDYSFKKNNIDNRLFKKIDEKIRANITVPEYLSTFNRGKLESLMNTKKMYHSGKNVKSWTSKRHDNDDRNDYLLYNIVNVTKSPCESRICAVADDNSRNLLYNAREMSKIIFKGKSRNFYGKKPWVAERMLHEDGSTFIMYDQKKCGWTFPFEYLISAFEAAYEATGHQNWKDLADIYKNNRVYYDILGIRYTPVRGFTLGMWDNVVSYIMECIFEVYLENCIDEDQREYLSALFFGDDCVLKLKHNEKCYLSLNDVWAEFLSMLILAGIELNTKKSFFADFGIFCEMYGNNSTIFNHKVVNYLLNGIDILTKPFVFERKICLNSFKEQMEQYVEYLPKSIQNIFLSYVKTILIKVIRETPIEFSEDDHYFPLEIGGWFREVEDGLSTFLLKLSKKYFRKERSKLVLCTNFTDFVSSFGKKDMKKQFDDWYELSQNNLVSIYESESLPMLLKKLVYFNNTNTIRKTLKFKEKYQEYRKSMFLKEPKTDILSYAYRKCCANQHFPEDMFTEISPLHAGFIRGLKQTPFKFPSGFNENTTGSIDMINKYLDVSEANNIRRANIANLYRDIAISKYPIPTYWFKFCLSNRMSLEEVYHRLQDIGLDIQNVQPKYATRYEDIESSIYPLNNDFLYWDNITASYYEISYEDCNFCLYKTEEQVSEYLYNKYYRETGIEYYLFLDHMKFIPKTNEEEDYTEEDLKTLAEWESKYINNNITKNEVSIERTIYDNIYHIQEDIGYDSDRSEEKTGPGYFRGIYIHYLDPDHEDFDHMLKNFIENDIPIDPMDYQDEIREYPILGSFCQRLGSDDESEHNDDFNEDEDPG